MSEGTESRRRSHVDVFKYLDYREFLAAYYRARKPRGFSYRAFSRAAKLGAPNYLKLVIEGQRNLTPTMAGRFAAACHLEGDAAEYFVLLVELNDGSDSDAREHAYARLSGFRRYRRAHRLDLAHAAYHGRWYVPAIRELVASPHFHDDPRWIAATLRPAIKPAQARQALELLLELRLLERDAEGRLRQRAEVVSTGAETQGVHIGAYHKEMMRQAIASIDEFSAVERDISALTLCVGPRTLPRLKQRIADFRQELLRLAESDPHPDQVVQCNFQFFPLSRRTHEEEKS